MTDQPDNPRAVEGDNSKKAVPGGIAYEALRSIVQRVERLEGEKKALSDDIKDVYAEAKANGFDTKILRQAVRRRKMNAATREEQDSLLDLYEHALGVFA